VIEETLTDTLTGLGEYYGKNQLRANPRKTQVCVFHLISKEAKRQLNITCTKAKISTHNNILRKFANTRLSDILDTIRSTALALRFSTAEYACPACCVGEIITC